MTTAATPTAKTDLGSLVAPLDAAAFLRDVWGQAFRHVPGAPGKFTSLLPWEDLNRILEQHRLEPPRLRLTREGKPVPPARFLSYGANRRRSGQPIPRLLAAGLERELRGGATLVLDAVDELHGPVTRLAESLERVFRVRVQVNAYAGWRTSHGFDLHWDDHDVFILQVAGRKQWRVYGMAVDPPKDPLWEGMLEDGDLLYIPRGWWHVATPLDEPTLHLTVGVNNPTGADLLGWFADRLRAREEVRRDIPLFGPEGERAAWLERLREAIEAEWSPRLIDSYLASLDAKAPARPRVRLPWSATPAVLPPGACRVRWAGARRLPLAMAGGEVTVEAHGRRWRFAAAAAPVLERLLAGGWYAPDELAGGALDGATVRAFLRELAAEGLVTAE